jgi:hypothetical protein
MTALVAANRPSVLILRKRTYPFVSSPIFAVGAFFITDRIPT